MAENRYLIDARMEISALNETLNLNLPMGDYETLAGFLIAQSGICPAPARWWNGAGCASSSAGPSPGR